jgi:8-oxo-dGTP pyrophosphatase MutT (NUDIX family)
MVLIDIRNMPQSMKSKGNDKDINKFPLPKIDDAFDDASAVPREIFEEVNIKTNPEDVGLFVGHTPRVLMQGRKKSRRRTSSRIPL